MTSRYLCLAAAIAIALTAALTVPAGAPALVRGAGSDDPYLLSVQALLGPERTDLYLSVDPAESGLAPPSELGLVQVKVFDESGDHLRTQTFHQVASPSGEAVVSLEGLLRKQLVEVKAHAMEHDQNNLEARATVLRRPDLKVRASVAPRVVRTHPFVLQAEVSEVGGDTGATAVVSLSDGGTPATRSVSVAAGGTTTVEFPLVYPTAGSRAFALGVGSSQPAEFSTDNNGASASTLVARYSHDGAVVSDEPYATDVGIKVLAAGGNAVDAAVAMQFALGVTQPQNVGLGGGATIVLHIEGQGDFAIDAREISPADTDPSQYRNAAGSGFNTNADSSGYIVGVPGSLAAAKVLLDRWGTDSLAESLAPAIDLAENGFTVGQALATATDPGRRCQNVGQPETKALFCSGSGLEPGSTFRNLDLAKSYRLVAEQGVDVLYRGEIAGAIVQATKRNRVPAGLGVPGIGRMTLDDIAAYTVDTDALVHVKYRDYDLRSVGGSSAGGYVALGALRMLDLRRDDFPFGDEAAGFGWLGPNTAHVMAETAGGLAFADHFYWMGGGEISGTGPVKNLSLLNDCYLGPRSELIKLDSRLQRTPVSARPIGDPRCGAVGRMSPVEATEVVSEAGQDQTSHFSVLDKWGNAASFTTTLTDAFGSGILVPGYGFALNDALANFNPVPNRVDGAFPKPGNPGVNDAGPSKRARGYTTPLIAFRDGEIVLITGSPGGFAIPSVVVNVVMNMFDFGMNVSQAVNAPRIWFNLTNVLSSAGVPAATLDHLRSLGHGVPAPGTVGGAQSIAVDPAFALSFAEDGVIPDSAGDLVEP